MEENSSKDTESVGSGPSVTKELMDFEPLSKKLQRFVSPALGDKDLSEVASHNREGPGKVEGRQELCRILKLNNRFIERSTLPKQSCLRRADRGRTFWIVSLLILVKRIECLREAGASGFDATNQMGLLSRNLEEVNRYHHTLYFEDFHRLFTERGSQKIGRALCQSQHSRRSTRDENWCAFPGDPEPRDLGRKFAQPGHFLVLRYPGFQQQKKLPKPQRDSRPPAPGFLAPARDDFEGKFSEEVAIKRTSGRPFSPVAALRYVADASPEPIPRRRRSPHPTNHR